MIPTQMCLQFFLQGSKMKDDMNCVDNELSKLFNLQIYEYFLSSETSNASLMFHEHLFH